MDMDQIWDLFRMVSRDPQANVASSSRAPNLAASSSATPPGRVRKINDHVYEVSNLSGRRPSLELIFFHGLQLEGSQEPHLDTWLSRDGNDLWLMWILDHFPDARILTVSYDAHEKMTDEGGRNDMYVTTENLLHDLIGPSPGGAQIGQSECPLVLVGHCLGGLVMKQLCVYADSRLSLVSDAQKSVTRRFLKKIKGLFFYATPHLGTRLADTDTLFIKGLLFQDATTLNTEVARRNEDFRRLCTNHGWKTFAIGENHPMSVGKFKGLFVPEASARHLMDEFYTADGNHNNICRPESTSSSNYSNLLSFVRGIMEEAMVPVHERQGLPSYPIGLERHAWDVQKILEGGAILGICGMGGIGKTTLAKKIFNTMSEDFEYTCFVDNVKGINVRDLNGTVLEHFHQNGMKLDKALAQWSQLKDKKILLVMDDVDSEEQLKSSPALKNFKKGSCLIMTSRDREVFKFYRDCSIYEVELLEAKEAEELFCLNAFGLDPIPDILRKHVTAIVEKCNGLPLTLEVLGRYLRGRTTKVVLWEQIMDKLEKATPIHGNDRVWALLKVSYDGLSREEQAIFIEAAMIFFEKPLDQALMAWGNAETTWENLVSRSMAKEIIKQHYDPYSCLVIKSKTVWVHEHLRDLAKSIANDDIVLHGYGQYLSAVVNNLTANEVPAVTISLRSDRDARSKLQLDSLLRLKQLKYLEMDRVNIECRRRFLKLPFRPIKIKMDNLLVLELSRCEIPNVFVEALGNLTNLRILSLIGLKGFQRLPKNFGNLTQLRRLIISGCTEIKCLPQDFSELSRLEELFIYHCWHLEELGDSFGHLTSLRKLILLNVGIQRLPANFDHLSALEDLTLKYVDQLKNLSVDFGQLTALKDLRLEAEELDSLPENFHFPKFLQKVVLYCFKLERLPENFYFLKSLQELTLFCPELKSFSDDFGQFTALKDLYISSEALETLPENFSFLKSLQKLTLVCPVLERLPESLGLMTSLREVELRNCWRLKSVPDSLGKPSSPQSGFLQGHETDAGECSQTKHTEGVLLGVDDCPYLSNLVLGTFGWGTVPSERYAWYFKRHAWVVHNDVKCDGCAMSPLEGQRYKSSIRSDYDLCHSCFQKRGSDASEYTCIERPVIPADHPCRQCDECGIYPPEGPRYKSSTKFDYVLCPDCFQKSGSNASEYASVDLSSFEFRTRCAGCEMYPLKGPRYCLRRMYSYNLCDACFVRSGGNVYKYSRMDRALNRY